MFLGEDHRTKKNSCLYCNHKLDGATQVNGNHQPKPGDVSICIACGNVSIFKEDMTLRKPSPEEEAEMQNDPNILEAQRAIFASYVAAALRKQFH